jgi:hypothetical protein
VWAASREPSVIRSALNVCSILCHDFFLSSLSELSDLGSVELSVVSNQSLVWVLRNRIHWTTSGRKFCLVETVDVLTSSLSSHPLMQPHVISLATKTAGDASWDDPSRI